MDAQVMNKENLEAKQVTSMPCRSCPSPRNLIEPLDNLSIKSSLSKRSARVLAELEEQHRRKEKLLLIELHKARSEVAKVKAAFDRSRHPACSQFVIYDDKAELEDCHSKERDFKTPYFTAPVPRIHKEDDVVENTPVEGISSLMSGMQLPKVELAYFDGNPVGYLKFMKQFEYYVESKTQDPGQRLLHLLHYCRGKARESIDECILLPPLEAYRRARSILKDQFGQPFVIARSLIKDLMELARNASSNAQSLSNLAIKMRNVEIALEQLNYQSDLNALHTLEGIVRKLSSRMQIKWAEEVEASTSFGYEPTFSDLTEFVARESKIANSRFGQLAERSLLTRHNVLQGASGTHQQSKAKVLASRMEEVCRFCNEVHTLVQCPLFRNLQVNERWSQAKRLGVCFTCLNASHRSNKCHLKKACGENQCQKIHHPLLHHEISKPESKLVYTTTSSTQCVARLGVVPVLVETPQGPVKTLAFLDGGSDTTLVKESFIKRYGIDGIPVRLNISTVNGSIDCECLKIELCLSSVDGANRLRIQGAYSVKDIPVRPLKSVKAEAAEWSHLREINFQEVSGGEVCILLGCDSSAAHRIYDQRFGSDKEPYANLTVFGWVLCGPSGKHQISKSSINCTCSSEGMIENQLRLLYNHEFGDLSTDVNTLSVEDHMAVSIVSQGTCLMDGHFEVPLPRRTHSFPNNFVDAKRRALSLNRKLRKDKDLSSRYVALMQKHIEKGYLEPIPQSEIDRSEGALEWYMPHHPVFNPKKPGKLRIVFDCAAKYKGCSLNDTLLQGPDLTTNLVAVLLRFRVHPVAISADIEEMFLQVRVPERDRNSLRILWWPNGQFDENPSVYRMTVHPFGATSSPFCANFALKKCAELFVDNEAVIVRDAVEKSFYVDDCLISLPDIMTAVKFVNVISESLARGGFRLTKWISNNREVLQHIPEKERSPNVKDLSSKLLPLDRALGIDWDTEDDCFVFSLDLKERAATRRGLLSTVSSLYDPLGFVAPWLLPGKMLLQDLCKRKFGWDEPLDDANGKLLKNWLKTVRSLHELRIPRWIIGLKEDVVTELHVFSDASEVGYGAVAYICLIDAEGGRRCQLLFSKARVAPIKAVSVPRLELAAAVLSIRIYQLLKDADIVDFNGVYFWTDSMIVLHYINNTTSRFSTFVANRLAKIHDLSNATQWHYVKSVDNPADKTSRGMCNFQHREDWLNGPKFLHYPKDTWPQLPTLECSSDQIELKRKEIVVNLIKVDEFWHALWERYSDWRRLLKAVVWLSRYKTYLSILHGRKHDIHLQVGHMKVFELRNAELDIIRIVQTQTFPLEMTALTEGSTHLHALKNSCLKKLRPILIDNVLRVDGRLQNKLAAFDERHPIILPRRHTVTRLILRYLHLCEGHIGIAHLLAVVRKRYWIPHGVSAVKEVLNSCMICRRKNAPIGRQLMAPLPIERVNSSWYPFSETGVDYFGPFTVRQGRCLLKRYGCIFSCLQTRAVHLEVAHSLDTQSFLMCLTRFVARRGKPENLYSDNGTNFIGAERELRLLVGTLDQNRIATSLAQRAIQWHFLPPYASHRGGVWERMIRSVRKVLTFVLQEQNPSDETLLTAFVEVERILNNRPIVPVISDDPDSLALTPNDLLIMRSNAGMNSDIDITQRYHSRWKQARHIATAFWKRWTSDYLPTLQARQKWLTKHRNFQIGDIVLVVSEALPREHWPLGMIVKCFPDSDGLVRTVDVRTKNGILKRDIRKLCLLEGIGVAVGRSDAFNSDHRCRDVGPPQVGDGSSDLSHPEGPPGVNRTEGAVPISNRAEDWD